MAGRRPLDGLRVLDFTNMLAGPYCTRLLADLGAEVFKVEPPEGDHNRARRPVRNGHSSFFGHVNAGKKSVVLDLKSQEGLEAALTLAKQADVLVENWRPGVAARLGVGYAAVKAFNPRIVYCSISGFGQTGPGSQHPAYAPIVHAMSGYDLWQMQYQGAERPANTGTFIADAVGGLAGFGAIQTALRLRDQTGEGQFIDVALLDGMLNLLVFELQEVQARSAKAIRVYMPIRAQDGFLVVAPTSQRNFETLARTIGHPEWTADPRFVRTQIREEHWAELMRLIEGWTSQRSAAECERLLLAAGFPCTRYRTAEEAMADPQAQARGSFATVRDPEGEYLVPNAPFQIAGWTTSVRPEVAALGEHNGDMPRPVAAPTAKAH
jgi:crotonobetainyl-CoA:carnitine CoA-transferase CaiB-like acyl-CoA transferase